MASKARAPAPAPAPATAARAVAAAPPAPPPPAAAPQQQQQQQAPGPDASVVGASFAQQYYRVLSRTPELLHRFYNENSTMVVATDDASGLPPGSAHAASNNTTPAPAAKGQRAIDAKVLSLGYDAKEAEVHSVDSVRSVAGSVLVLVRGALVGKGDAAKKDSTTRFSQAFVLAPQENGYFVLSDIVRFAPAAGPSGAAAGVAPAAKSAGPNAGGGAADAAGPANAKADAEKAANADANANANAKAGARASPPPTLPQPSLSLEALEAKQRAAADAAAATTEAGSAAPAAAAAAPEPAPAIVEPKTYAERLKMKARMAAPPPITPAPPSSLVPAVSGPTPTPSAAVPSAANSKAQVARPPAVLGAPKGGVATGTTVNPCAVFARGLTEAATAESIRAAFAPFGVVKEGSAGVQIRPRKNGNERYAFVEFESPEGAAAAMRATVELDGVALGVEGKREKVGGEGGGGGGGGGGRGGDRRRGGPGGAEGGHERGGGRGGEGGGRGGRGGRGGGRGRGEGGRGRGRGRG